MRRKAHNPVERLTNALRCCDRAQAINTVLNYFERRQEKIILKTAPLIVQVEVTNRCNLNCVFCSRYTQELQLGDLDESLIPDIVDFSRRSREMILYGYGEPLISKSLRTLLKQGKNGRFSFTTNGLLMTAQLLEELNSVANRPIENITFSIDAADKSTYQSIRGKVDFDKLWNNLKTLREYKAENDSKMPELRINFVAMKRNIEQLPKLIEKASEHGVTHIVVFQLVVWDEQFEKDSLIDEPEMTRRVFQQSKDIADRLGVKIDLPVEIGAPDAKTSTATPLPKCYQPWSYSYVRYDGEVQACCFSEKLTMGNLHEKSFQEIWNDQPYRKLRQSVNTNPIPECANCEMRYRYTQSPNDREVYIKLAPRTK